MSSSTECSQKELKWAAQDPLLRAPAVVSMMIVRGKEIRCEVCQGGRSWQE